MKCLHSQHSPGHTQIIISYFSATLWNVYASQWLLFLITALWINHSWGGLTRKHVYTGPSVNLKASLRPNQRSTTWFMKQRLNYLCASSRSCLISLLEAFALLFWFCFVLFFGCRSSYVRLSIIFIAMEHVNKHEWGIAKALLVTRNVVWCINKAFFLSSCTPTVFSYQKWAPFNSYIIAYYYYYKCIYY